MRKEHRDKVTDAIWKAICTTRMNLRYDHWNNFLGDDKFSQEDTVAIFAEIEQRLSNTDRGRGGNVYWQHLQACEFVADVMWTTALGIQLGRAKTAVCSGSGPGGERFDIQALRRMEAYLIEHSIRDKLIGKLSKELGAIVHVPGKQS